MEGGWGGRSGSIYKTGCERVMTHMEVAGRYVKQIWLVSGWAKGWQFKTIVVVDGCLLSLSLCRRGFQDLFKVRPSSLFILCGCISSSVASLMSRSMYLVLAERSFVSCSLIMWSWLILCSTADLSGCASLICLLCWYGVGLIDRFVQYKPCRIHMGCCICPVFLMHPWQEEGSWIFF